MALRIFIVDDEMPARARLQTLLSDIAESCATDVLGEADSAEKAWVQIQTSPPDVILLDVHMPGESGVQLAEKVATLPEPPAIIFITAYEQYALQAFDVAAVDYLLKPVRALRLLAALQRVERVKANALNQQNTAYFSVSERGSLLQVPVKDVRYVRAEMKYLTLHTAQKDYLIESTLNAIEQKYPNEFLRIHRNTLVAPSAIQKLEKKWLPATSADGEDEGQEVWQVVITGSGERLAISRRQLPFVKSFIRD